ncbi:hypothetical protein ACROYT_G014459 [Oculina patagonica]
MARRSDRLASRDPEIVEMQFECFFCKRKGFTCQTNVFRLSCCSNFCHKTCQEVWDKTWDLCGFCCKEKTIASQMESNVKVEENANEETSASQLESTEAEENPKEVIRSLLHNEQGLEELMSYTPQGYSETMLEYFCEFRTMLSAANRGALDGQIIFTLSDSGSKCASLKLTVSGTMAHKHQKHFAAADDPEYQKPLQTQLHCEYYKRGVYTQYCTFADVIKVSEFFQAYAAHDLRWCSLCNDNHPPTLICFSESCMKPQNQEGVLDSTLNFKWTMDGLQDRVFQLCRYFIINEDHLLPLYLDSLTPDCARFYDSYQYLSLMSNVIEVQLEEDFSEIIALITPLKKVICCAPIKRDTVKPKDFVPTNARQYLGIFDQMFATIEMELVKLAIASPGFTVSFENANMHFGANPISFLRQSNNLVRFVGSPGRKLIISFVKPTIRRTMANKHQKHFAAADDPEYQKPL